MADLVMPVGGSERVEASGSGVSWAAVAGGAFVAAALSFSLMALGAGMGLSSVSPWPTAGATASRVAPAALVWIILVQAASCALGGYLAGRLRTRWVTVHTHEVYFRDTAHGLLAWAVGLVISVFFLSSVGLSIAKDATSAVAEGRNDYYTDALFRTNHPNVEGNDAAFRAEAREVLARALRSQEIAQKDSGYLADMVAARSGLTPTEAEARVSSTLALARQDLDSARRAVAHSLYWLFAALLIGAFCGSVAATVGGKQRDRAMILDAAIPRRA